MREPALDVMRLHSREEFQTWLAKDQEARDELAALAGVELAPDEASLDTLEEFLLERFGGPDDALRLGGREVLDAAVRHIGLVMILNVDVSKWDIDLDDTDSVYYRLPVIRMRDGVEECPLSLATASLDRRTGHYMRPIV
jgi:hypothetical protein